MKKYMSHFVIFLFASLISSGAFAQPSVDPCKKWVDGGARGGVWTNGNIGYAELEVLKAELSGDGCNLTFTYQSGNNAKREYSMTSKEVDSFESLLSYGMIWVNYKQDGSFDVQHRGRGYNYATFVKKN